MPFARSIRAGLLLALWFAVVVRAHPQGLPATPATSAPVTNTTPAPAPVPAAGVDTPRGPSATPAQRARVEFTAGKLAITAQNSSLNQILFEVARTTGLKITGGLTDERVFGTYGPGETSAVLSALLDGSGSNVLFIATPGNAPQELVLTPRHGGASPPSPGANASAVAYPADATDAPPAPVPHQASAQQLPAKQAPTEETTGAGTPATQTPATQNPATQITPAQAPEAQQTSPAATEPPAPVAPGTTTEQSPNGVKTPQQIYDQLMKLQQQPKPAAATPPK